MKVAKNITLSDVARHAGVSQMTVSKVLRGVGSISADTSERVRNSIHELGYVTNAIAGALSAQKSSTVGVIIPSIADSVFSEIISTLSDLLYSRGLSIMMAESNFNDDIEEHQIRNLMSLRPAAIVLTGGTKRTEGTTRLLSSSPAPIIQLWDADEPIDGVNIGPSHIEAGHMAAQHFLSCGLKSIAYIGAELEKDLCAAQRANAFAQHLAQEGIQVQMLSDENLPRQAQSGSVLTERLFEQNKLPDGIFYLNDAMASGGLRVLFQRDIDVPNAVSVLGFNGTSRLHTVRTELTTISVDRNGIGTETANAIQTILDGGVIPKPKPTKLIFMPGTTG